ncbi:TetR/AcrR family transcriptional regulator [Nocardiaceae bacterium YC2-7]|uniref:TetR/AcrR family transcriptional regulator n=2 Tax=Antrihabitans stalactiti TaxID=2584121 RepID=A0A848K612_9NOCA|nr:TetR/AcrR family transcriptional regulator [Antrihabitans stalactiti]
MAAADRRELILQAATRAFAKGGYAGTSTDAVAREAGVSQPYVVRMFGTKVELFREVYVRSSDMVMATFDAALDELDIEPESQAFWDSLGAAYSELISDRDLLLVMMHGFSAASTPEIGAAARKCMSATYKQLRDRTGCTPEQARGFISHGMLLNILLAMNAPDYAAEDPALAELSVCAFGPTLDAALTDPTT